MGLKKSGQAICAAAFMTFTSASASAGVVLDGWQLWTPTGVTTNIGRLNLVGGTGAVEQQVDGTGNAFVGARFAEFGSLFSLQFTPENVVGVGDIGSPSILSDSLRLTFSNVMGTVSALNAGGGFHYVFDSGSFVLSGIGGNYASGSIVGQSGNWSSTAIAGGLSGDSTLLAQVVSIMNLNFDLRDSAAISLKPELVSGEVLFETVAHNNSTGGPVVGNCSFLNTARCISRDLASTGEAYLVRDSSVPVPVPEPSSLALAGLALFGLGATRRRSRK
jgi:hypothetical protein